MPFNRNKKDGITKQSINPPLLNVNRSLSLGQVLKDLQPSDSYKISELEKSEHGFKSSIMKFISGILKNVTHNIRQQFRGYIIAFDPAYILTESSAGVYTKLAYTNAYIMDVNYDTTNYNFTAPRAGVYTVKASFFGTEDIPLTTRDNRAFGFPSLDVFVNETNYVNITHDTQQIDYLSLDGSALVYLECGDVMDIRLHYQHQVSGAFNIIDITGELNINYEGNSTELTGNPLIPFIAPFWIYNFELQ